MQTFLFQLSVSNAHWSQSPVSLSIFGSQFSKGGNLQSRTIFRCDGGAARLKLSEVATSRHFDSSMELYKVHAQKTAETLT